ncbi:related to POM33 - transmembrane nucleoporin involved in nuclear pore complex distribution [Ustilago trichophora]|uniref:Related to POM33 - transmembrane nucleoporin involved in nuclear pore complex distribution n=1 Tax=Ustilago trichophora TaxID=86804 RepID=A0A5C3ENY1_9BASI|nr:related to POM33 - transmembrane nucleoporin involved in nuclear pore complex distribution [Ustilago trichophora]
MPRPSASTPHLIWAAGHFLCFFAGLRYLVGTLMFATSSGGLSRWYYAAYLGAIISYCVVVYKSFGVPQLNKPYIQRALMDENVQYLFLAVYWFMSKPIFITLVPFVTFSLFHVLTFLRTTVIPMVFPSAAPTPTPTPTAAAATVNSASSSTPATSASAKISKFIQSWVKANYDPAMRFVAYAEVAIFARVLFGALLFRNSLMAPLFYAHFLRLRFYMSSFTRAAFQHVKNILDAYTQHQSCPPVVRKAYLTLTDLISRYASSVLSVHNSTPPANQNIPQPHPPPPQRR